MANTTQVIGPLVGGVSQAPAHLRPQEYATELINALAHQTFGTTKRPGSRHVAKLGGSTSEYTNASLFDFNAGDKRRYILAVGSGSVRVIEADTGIERTVEIADGALDYLSGTLDDTRAFSAVATGDTLYLVNRARVVEMASESQPTRAPEGVIAIRAADFGTTYSVVINGAIASYKTPEGTSANVRSLISTDAIAEQLAGAIAQRAGGDQFNITRSGSALHITRRDGGNFTLASGDGLADSGITLLFGTVASNIDLPPTGVVEGFTVRVLGDPQRDGDDSWVAWSGGVWKEVPRPGSQVSLDASTMPHTLVLGGALHDGLTVPDAPPQPTCQIGASVVPLVWTVFPPSSYSSDSLSLRGNSEADTNAVPADGTEGRVDVEYDMDTTGLDNSWIATVKLLQVSGGAETELDSIDYPAGSLYTGRMSTGTATFAPGDVIRLRVVDTDTGTSDPTQPNPGQRITDTSVLNVQPSAADMGAAAGVRYTPTGSSQLSMPPDVVYPETATVTVNSDGGSVTHTVPTGGETGQAIAAAIAAAWPGPVTCVNLGGGKLVFRNGTSIPPGLTASTVFDPAAKLYVPDGSFASNSLVGLRLIDLTTGAETTITGNTARVLSFSPLSGGTAATLRPGDVVRVASAPDSFSFSRVSWEKRTTGDDVTNPPPSFVGKTISDVGVTQNRLVFTHGEYVVASGASKFGRFFRTTTQQVLESDVVDVRGTASRGLPFWHAVEWNGSLHLLNGRSIYALAGEPLSPRNVALPHVYELSTNEACRPVVVGRRLYVARSQNGFTQLVGLELAGPEGVDSFDTTQDVAKYLIGDPVALAADAEGPLVIITEKGATRYVYAMQTVTVNRATVFAWSTWTFDAGAKPLAVTMDGGELILVIARADGVYLESLDTLADLT